MEVHGPNTQNPPMAAAIMKNAHINELTSSYPWRELFVLFQKSKYERYTLCECAESKEPERFLAYYKTLWTELNKACS
jgi:hypothetical protein